MSALAYGWTGWDIIERYDERATRLRPTEDQAEGTALELSADVVSTALLVEMQRPPWFREIDAQRRAERQEAA